MTLHAVSMQMHVRCAAVAPLCMSVDGRHKKRGHAMLVVVWSDPLGPTGEFNLGHLAVTSQYM